MTIASVLLTVLFAGTVAWRRRGLPESISAMVYDLPRPWQWLWTVWIWAVSLTACIPLIEAVPDGARPLGFLTLTCLMFVGAMPLLDVSNRFWHYALAIVAGVVSQVCVVTVSPWWMLAWLLFAAIYARDALPSQNGRNYPSRWYDGKGVLLAEMISATTVFGSLLVRI